MLLAGIFFVAQVFACCQANARLARTLASILSRTSHPAHACCAKTDPAAPPADSDCARNCCVQDAAQHAPELASVPSELPQFSVPHVFLPPVAEAPVALGE